MKAQTSGIESFDLDFDQVVAKSQSRNGTPYIEGNEINWMSSIEVRIPAATIL